MAKLMWLKQFVLFYGLMTIIVTVDKWLLGWVLKFTPEYQPLMVHYDTFIKMGLGQRLLGLLNEGVLTATFLGVLYYLYTVLRSIQGQQTFSQSTLNSLGKMAKFYLSYTILFPITMALQSMITTFHNPPGHRTLTISVGSINFDQILMAGVLYVIWYVMKEAYQVSTEHSMVI